MIMLANIYIKKNMFKFILSLNSVAEKHAKNFLIISSNAKSVLLNDPDIQVLRKYNSK
jgi:endo-alpha-1,4-polygalactosaminidase (GH114 family)